jgi:hypothetical protein
MRMVQGSCHNSTFAKVLGLLDACGFSFEGVNGGAGCAG